MTEEEQGGYDEYEDNISQEDINDLVDKVNSAESKNVQLNQALTSLSQEKKDGNFLHHQLSTEPLLEKLEHFYAGDFRGKDSEGNIDWQKQTDKDLITFNHFGVTSIMEIISKYIDKNTILSDYSEMRIYEILGDLGDELILFILCNYEKLGMDTPFKKSKFRVVITTTLHIIESTYRRAKNGRTLEEINQSKVVSQFGEKPMISPMSTGRRTNPIRRMLGMG